MTYTAQSSSLLLPPSPVDPTVPAPENVPFHRRALINPRHRWWRPIVTILVSVAVYVVLVLVAIVVAMLTSPELDALLSSENFDMNRPEVAAATTISLALMIPSIAIGVRVGERRRLGTMSSIAGRLRVGLLGRYGALALLCTGLSLALALVTELIVHPELTLQPTWSATSLGMLACALLLVPFQAAAEEYAFRALPQQVLGSWLKSPWWGILLPIPLFVLGHEYELQGQLAVGFFALAAGILTWRTGGLEAAIALHIVNNALIFALGAIGLADLNATGGSWLGLLIDAAGVTLFCALVLRHHAKTQLS
ncbi:CPBP family intramembrane glutamic endopeptidase [Tessaracoccus caeni]|uniref:CPBP family intramembrane glutamic endopeptidase n=1 Tax=Tessaracoccus caeni TaxID=3031239 RepID=UPI0023DAFFAF|nr:CPBP family intramembrane glutamic endopeptidase [Tessaracoccus caeni]MDF1486916.1 CPBP family intramembrane metalloprotease [Tessaracoccus caeni]